MKRGTAWVSSGPKKLHHATPLWSQVLSHSSDILSVRAMATNAVAGRRSDLARMHAHVQPNRRTTRGMRDYRQRHQVSAEVTHLHGRSGHRLGKDRSGSGGDCHVGGLHLSLRRWSHGVVSLRTGHAASACRCVLDPLLQILAFAWSPASGPELPFRRQPVERDFGSPNMCLARSSGYAHASLPCLLQRCRPDLATRRNLGVPAQTKPDQAMLSLGAVIWRAARHPHLDGKRTAGHRASRDACPAHGQGSAKANKLNLGDDRVHFSSAIDCARREPGRADVVSTVARSRN